MSVRTVSRRRAAPQLDDCDLVMKGGITSGVVYPAAVKALSDRYRFRSIGGASAGAIAAALTAAAEYGRRHGGSGFAVLDEVNREMVEDPQFLLNLFQPTPPARPLYGILLGFAGDTSSSPSRKVRRAVLAVLRAVPQVSVPAAVLVAGLIGVVAAGSTGVWRFATVPLAVVFGVLGAVLAVIVAGAVLALRFYHGVEANGFGLCRGMSEPGGSGLGFTEWLHEKVQRGAGLPMDEPLTFRHLLEDDPKIDLKLITTDLSYSRPVTLPLPDQSYLFRRSEMDRLFPPEVVKAMWEAGSKPDPDFLKLFLDRGLEEYSYMPSLDLPVVVAFRFSLSFPVLISGVKLYTYNALVGDILPNWFSDGGISSNFPIHFFDSLLPGRPTFGLDFQPFPQAGADAIRVTIPDDVFMPTKPWEQERPRWAHVKRFPGFLSQIIDAFENWRDTMQSELPGFRDRICHVLLHENEGGINLAMPPETIRGLIERGDRAGRKILDTFDQTRWRNHRFTRYLTAMQQLQVSLQKMGAPERFGALDAELRVGLPEVTAYRQCHDTAWCRKAALATTRLLKEGQSWGSPGRAIFHMDSACEDDPASCLHCEPEPMPVLRIVPSV